MSKETIKIKYQISMSTCHGAEATDEVEVNRKDWELMSDQEREEYGNECVDTLIGNVISGYWEVLDD